MSKFNEILQRTQRWCAAVLKKQGAYCHYCGTTHNIDVHHIWTKKSHPEWRYNVANGIPLCRDCHIAVHSGGDYIMAHVVDRKWLYGYLRDGYGEIIQ